MCKCCQHCVESCYWHLIEKRFCFDEDIALYQEPLEKEEKNNNFFDNMAFYDSVSVIAGRAIVTIDPLPEKNKQPIIVQQPRRLKWQEKKINDTKNEIIKINSNPSASKEKSDEDTTTSDSQEEMVKSEVPSENITIKKSVSFDNILEETKNNLKTSQAITKSSNNLLVPKIEARKKSLRERRMSKSLYLKIDYPKEVPIIRQNSMPKFFLDTPEDNQTESTLYKTPLTALQSPMVKDGYAYDLYSVVQMEKIKGQTFAKDVVPIHRESSRLSQIKGKIKLKKSKSTISASNIPHSNYI